MGNAEYMGRYFHSFPTQIGDFGSFQITAMDKTIILVVMFVVALTVTEAFRAPAFRAPAYQCACGDSAYQCQDRPSIAWDCGRLHRTARLRCEEYKKGWGSLIVECKDLKEKKWCVSGGQLGSILSDIAHAMCFETCNCK